MVDLVRFELSDRKTLERFRLLGLFQNFFEDGVQLFVQGFYNWQDSVHFFLT